MRIRLVAGMRNRDAVAAMLEGVGQRRKASSFQLLRSEVVCVPMTRSDRPSGVCDMTLPRPRIHL